MVINLKNIKSEEFFDKKYEDERISKGEKC
jgi:hypothetical protein